MRNVITTVASLDVSDEYSQAVDTTLTEISLTGSPGLVLRETRQGRDAEMYRTRLVSYPAPDTGETVYAVDDQDPATHEVEETSDEAEANARYEEVVRARAAAAGNADEDLLDYSDVEGVAAKENPTDD